METLHQQWLGLLQSFSSTEEKAERLWRELRAQYRAAGRHYHNLEHIADLLQQAEEWSGELHDPALLALSIWYHDAIYRSWRRDNEAQSADLARRRLRELGLSEAQIEAVAQQILCTQAHRITTEDQDTPYLLDFDLAILGRPPADYERYCQQIRREYRIFPDFLYRRGRVQALQHFLGRPFIFHLPTYRDRYEDQARGNLQRELEQWR